MLIDGEDRIVDGMVRLEAAKLAGLARALHSVGHLSAAEVRTLRLGLNRLQEKGVWDLDRYGGTVGA